MIPVEFGHAPTLPFPKFLIANLFQQQKYISEGCY